MFELSGKHAVVTGGASGIGLAIATLFVKQGASVSILDLDGNKATEVAATLADGKATVQGLACDVSSEENVRDTFAGIRDLDILVNSAGISHVGNLLSTTAAEMERLFAINVQGTFLCMRAAVSSMVARKSGVILNMASIAATAALTDRFAYSMTKGAVRAMTLSVAKDYLQHGIRCNCISPARVHTPFVDGYLKRNYPGQEAEQMKKLEQSQPVGRMGRPDEVAALALYLCSSEAEFITGADYPLDGGFFNLR